MPNKLKTSSLLAPALTLCALASPAAAQFGTSNVSVLMRTGEVLNGETVTGLREPSIAASGKWAAICLLNSTPQQGVIIDGQLAIAEGDLTVDGSTLNRIRQVSVSTDGAVALFFDVEDPADPSNPIDRIRIGNDLILEEGMTVNYPVAGVAGTISGVYGMDYDAPTLSVGMFVAPPGGGLQRAFLVGTVSGGSFVATGGIVGGTVPAGSTAGVPYFSPSQDCQAVAGVGGSHTANFSGGSGFSSGLLSQGQTIAEHGEPGPAPNSEWNFERFPRVRTNSSGTNIYTGQLTLSNGQDRGVIYVDGLPAAVQGGGLNGVLGGFAGQFETASIAIAEDDTPIFTVPLTVPGFEVLMAGSEIVLRSGTGVFATVVDGETIESLRTSVVDQSFDITPDGRTIIQSARLASGTGVILLAERDIADAVTCMAEPNSTGSVGEVSAQGSRFLGINDLSIIASSLPMNSFGYLGVSNSSIFVAMPGGSSGNLCIGPAVGRYVDQVQSTGAGSSIATTIDLTAIPQPTGFVGSLPGDTWYFQLWHRDSDMGGPTSNFTEALSVTVQ